MWESEVYFQKSTQELPALRPRNILFQNAMYTVVTLPGLIMALVYLMIFSLLLYETIFHIF